MRCAPLGVLLLACPAALDAAAPPTPPTDLYGDRLPPGAVARLGSVRLRHAGLNDFVCLRDGETVLTAGSDRVLRWWDLATGLPKKEVRLHGKAGPGEVVTLSPDGKTLASLVGGDAVLWDAATGKEVKRLPAPERANRHLFFSPDGGTLVLKLENHRLLLWEWGSGGRRELTLPSFPRGGLLTPVENTPPAFSPDGRWFAANTSFNEPLGVYDAATGREAYRLDVRAGCCAVSADGRTLAAFCPLNEKWAVEPVIRLFELKSGKPLKRIPLDKEDQFGSVAFSPDGRSLACSLPSRVRVLDVATGRFLHRMDGRTAGASFTPDGKTLVARSGSRLRVWDAATGKELHDRPGEFDPDLALAASPDGRRLAAAGWYERRVSVWDAATGRLVRHLPLKGDGKYVRTLAFSPHGRTLSACQYRGMVQTWDAATGAERRASQLIDADDAPLDRERLYSSFQLSADGASVRTVERIYNGGESGRLVLWDLASGKPRDIRPFAGTVGRGVWVGEAVGVGRNGGVSLLDAEDGYERFHIDAPAAGLRASPDDRLLAARLNSKGGVGVWEAATGKEVAALPAGRPTLFTVVPGNRLLLTADESHLRAWDLADGDERWRWRLPAAFTDAWGRTLVHTLFPLPDGRRAFVGLLDGTGLILDVAPAATPRVASEVEMNAWWADLTSGDARRAYVAGWRLGETPAAVALLRRRLRPVEAADEKSIRAHIAALDSDDFAPREKANAALAALGRVAVPELSRALAAKPPLDLHRRLEKLLTAARRAPLTGDELRGLRAVGVLEGSSSADARKLLAELAAGAKGAPLTAAAAAALRRVEQR